MVLLVFWLIHLLSDFWEIMRHATGDTRFAFLWGLSHLIDLYNISEFNHITKCNFGCSLNKPFPLIVFVVLCLEQFLKQDGWFRGQSKPITRSCIGCWQPYPYPICGLRFAQTKLLVRLSLFGYSCWIGTCLHILCTSYFLKSLLWQWSPMKHTLVTI